ncbi:hypothetical protein BLA29_013015 [Euroglyphus maynei]|uniref:Non-specific serine/threonine protein kinase n=1 Tax=Euroglyphus maynei TaxID=6958 RepID=A0A1Y3B2G4_EURMA|nr:hypothetical protein BLA29_013015 [Euroglyphus maynei]
MELGAWMLAMVHNFVAATSSQLPHLLTPPDRSLFLHNWCLPGGRRAVVGSSCEWILPPAKSELLKWRSSMHSRIDHIPKSCVQIKRAKKFNQVTEVSQMVQLAKDRKIGFKLLAVVNDDVGQLLHEFCIGGGEFLAEG